MSSASADLTCGMWETQELRGQWKKGSNAGGSRNFDSYTINPCFPFSVPDGAPQIRLTLRQQHSGEKCHAIGFHVYSKETLLGTHFFNHGHQVSQIRWQILEKVTIQQGLHK
ncbi:hypothetical protein XELAEV_18027448mg [Xenopus laevis]|uniref:Peptidase C2 calpain domain-containing protein n=1 Tax=Xenopus laevis TaxID=8355 RepID=A0A974HK28_XENLA|nr:hypothetical protein XELAEV_18027448mg [Xenopus laevis]